MLQNITQIPTILSKLFTVLDKRKFIMSNTLLRTVTIVRATGTLGYHIAKAFLNDRSYNVKVF